MTCTRAWTGFLRSLFISGKSVRNTHLPRLPRLTHFRLQRRYEHLDQVEVLLQNHPGPGPGSGSGSGSGSAVGLRPPLIRDSADLCASSAETPSVRAPLRSASSSSPAPRPGPGLGPGLGPAPPPDRDQDRDQVWDQVWDQPRLQTGTRTGTRSGTRSRTSSTRFNQIKCC